MSDEPKHQVITESVYTLVSWESTPAWTDDGLNVIAIHPIFQGPGQPHPVPAPPFVLTEEAAGKLVADLTRQLQVLQAKTAASRGRH